MASSANQHPIKAITNSHGSRCAFCTKDEFFSVGAVYDRADYVDFRETAPS